MQERELPDLDPTVAAKDAGLRYVSDSVPGIRRHSSGKSVSYEDADGKKIRDPLIIKRIDALVIPPAWTDVWICTQPSGHIQATGRDARGRKQYRYHEKWRVIRDKTKFEKLVDFGFVLPSIRKKIFEDLQEETLTQAKVLALVVRLLDVTHMRVGNEEYAEDNHSYGLTTLKQKHVQTRGADIRFSFRGKSGVEQDIGLHDKRLAAIIRQCQELPGYELFQYIDETGKKQCIDSEHVNDYLREIGKEEISAKDFRTWGGTVHAAGALAAFGNVDDEKERRHCLVCAVKEVAEILGNRPATCRKYYIDPRIPEAFEKQELKEALRGSEKRKKDTVPHGLHPLEQGVHRLLQLK